MFFKSESVWFVKFRNTSLLIALFSHYYQKSSLCFGLPFGDLHSPSLSFYWNPQLWISSFLFANSPC